MKPEAKKTRTLKSVPAKAKTKATPAKTKPAVRAAAAPKPRAMAKKVVRKTPPIPAILLEGDAPERPAFSGPGQRYALGTTSAGGGIVDLGELPESYGTRKLLLTARDPQWLYAHWDFTREQLKEANALSGIGHLTVRVYVNRPGGQPFTEVQVHPESRNWFIHVARGNTRFVAELGYYDTARKWTALATSTPTLTPPDSLADDISVRFATIPVEIPFEQLLSLVKAAVSENIPLAEALEQLRAEGHKGLPEIPAATTAPTAWTPEQERALAKVVSMDSVRRVWMGSLEITELIRRQLTEEMSSIVAAQFSRPTSPGGAVTSLSSPFGGEAAPGAKSFWFNVNAELIIYGATEPDATVTIGGRTIKLRGDGTFSYRFALPDGNYHLPVVATSADGDDARLADLKFNRSTDYRGDVAAHPQDAALKTPHAQNVA